MRRSEPGPVGTAVLVVVAATIGTCAVLIALGFGLVMLAQASLSALFFRDGDSTAEYRVRMKAEALTESLGYGRSSTDAETLAANVFADASSTTVSLVPYAWSGRVASGDQATVDVRISARVDASGPSSWFGPSTSAGSAERCYRFTVPMGEYASSRTIDCPDHAQAAPAPTATRDPELADDAESRLTAVLQVADPASLASAVRAAFPEAEVSADSVATADGELVAAVGVAVARDCVVLVRRVDGTIERVWFDRIQLEPGEGGCAVSLYTAPAL